MGCARLSLEGIRDSDGTKQTHGYAVVVCYVDVCAVVEEKAGGVDILNCVQGGVAISIGDVDVRACRVCEMSEGTKERVSIVPRERR
jgi:hypothetical protein